MKAQIVSAAEAPRGLVLEYKKDISHSGKGIAPGSQPLPVCEVFAWHRLTARFPLIYMLQPDFYVVHAQSVTSSPVYHANLRLQFEPGRRIHFEFIRDHIVDPDRQYLQKLDQVVSCFAAECRLQPFDFICTTAVRWEKPGLPQRFLLRHTTVLQSDHRGVPSHFLTTYKDVTGLVSAIRPFHPEILFQPDKSGFCEEIQRRLRHLTPSTVTMTCRERDIVRCLMQGLSSKQIANALFISKATVDTHRQNLLRKWDVPNTAALLKQVADAGHSL